MMTRTPSGRAWFIAGLVAAIVQASVTADAAVVASWQFEASDFLADSSGNGHTLIAGKAGSMPTASTDVSGSAGGSGSAYFDGSNGWIKTPATLNLSSYDAIRISAWIKPEGANTGVLWEHGANVNTVTGGFDAVVNDGGYGYATAALNVASAGFNADRCSPAQNAWQKLTVEYNRFASVPADNCKMYLNGTKVNDSGWTTYGMPPFINGILNVGARQGGSYYFNGKIDNLTIEDITPPPPALPRPTKLYILAGQSNAVGQYAYNNQLPADLQTSQDNVSLYVNSSWQTLAPGRGWLTSNFGPEVTLGHDLAAALPGERVGLVKYAVGATALHDYWKAGTGPGYVALLQTVRDAIAALGPGETPEIAGLAWMQGESDAIDNMGTHYQTNLTDLIRQLRIDLGLPKLKFAIGQIHHDWPGDPLDVMAAQAAVSALDPFAPLVYTDDLSLTGGHYNAAGQMTLGSRFASALVPEPASFVLLSLAVGFGFLYYIWPRNK